MPAKGSLKTKCFSGCLWRTEIKAMHLPHLTLAPMQGLCDDVMRDLLTRIGGYRECVSEFVRITHTVHSRPAWLRHVPELAHGCRTAAGVPCTVQLLGSDETMLAANAVQAVRFGAAAIDLNFGCPAPTVNKHQGGAVLLKEPERIGRIVRAVRQSLPPHIPLSAKIRLGYDDTELALDNAQAVSENGAALLTVHARTKADGYRPPARWHWLLRIREHVSVPVCANGDVFTLDDYRAIREESGCERIMLGRGAVIRPGLARQIQAYECGGAAEEADFYGEVAGWIRLFFDLCRQKPSEKYPTARLKQWLGMMKTAYPEAERLFAAVRTLKSVEETAAVLAAFGGGQQHPPAAFQTA